MILLFEFTPVLRVLTIVFLGGFVAVCIIEIEEWFKENNDMAKKIFRNIWKYVFFAFILCLVGWYYLLSTLRVLD